MPSEPNGSPVLPESAGALVSLGLWAGLVTGFAELAVVAIQLLGPGFILRSRDSLWMIPAFDAGLFALVGLVLVAVGRVVRISWRVAAGLFAGLGALLVLLLFHRLHPLAALVLAGGIGTQVARLLADRVPAATRLLQRSLLWLGLSVCVLAVGTIAWRAAREHWLIRARPPAEPGAPNLLLLILDTVRAVDLSLYGYARPTTPELERFAARGTVFDLAFAVASWTLPSHASMFTGCWPFQLGVTWEHGLDERWPTLAEVLRAHGYATAGFSGNAPAVSWETGLSRGFEHFDDYPISLWTATQATAFGNVLYGPVRRVVTPALRQLPGLWRVRLPVQGQSRPAGQISAAFLSWLDRARPAPFFAFLNFIDAHTPYTPPDSFRLRFHSPTLKPLVRESWSVAPKLPLTPADLQAKRDAYNGAIAYLDTELGRLFRELDRRGLLENTLVIVTADHGEEFAEHGLVEHGNSLYRRSLHVPLLVRFPGHAPEGQRVTVPVSLRNLAATVLDLLDVDRGAALPGRSLARLWSTQGAVPDTVAAGITRVPNQPSWYPASRGALNSIAFDGWEYIRNEGDGAEELYDFEHDVLERWNLVRTAEGDRLLPRYQAALSALLK